MIEIRRINREREERIVNNLRFSNFLLIHEQTTFPDSSRKREIAWSRLSTGFHPSTHGFTRDTVSILPVYARVYRYFLDSSQVDDPLITSRALSLPTISYRPIRRHLAIDALMRSPLPKASCARLRHPNSPCIVPSPSLPLPSERLTIT